MRPESVQLVAVDQLAQPMPAHLMNLFPLSRRKQRRFCNELLARSFTGPSALSGGRVRGGFEVVHRPIIGGLKKERNGNGTTQKSMI